MGIKKRKKLYADFKYTKKLQKVHLLKVIIKKLMKKFSFKVLLLIQKVFGL